MMTISGMCNKAVVFATTVESSCKEQIKALCDESWAVNSKIRIMADTHAGKGCVIGTTMTITDKVVPNLVGVDIGCGMLTTKFSCVDFDMSKLDAVIKKNIPMGMNIHESPVADFSSELDKLCNFKTQANYRKINRSLATLGGGNHFIEVDKDDEGYYYLVIHTGSRNFGKVLAEFYQNEAKAYHKKTDGKSKAAVIAELKACGRQQEIAKVLKEMAENTPPSENLEYLEGQLFQSYLNDMKIAQKFAQLNRKLIAEIICKKCGISPIEQFETIHNYIDTDNMILRKGAISAQQGEKCLIPINMRDGALICVGKGNPDYNFSGPHGAGRLMSRNEAKKKITMEAYQSSMTGIYSTTINQSTLDEAPMAYKPIDEILENIKDTVDVVKQVLPVYNIKASE